MDSNEIEKYKREMMRLYGRSSSQNEYRKEEVPVHKAETRETSEKATENECEDDIIQIPSAAAESEKIPTEDEESPDDTAWSPHPEEDREESSDIEDEYNTKYPEPDLFETDNDDGTGSEYNLVPPEYDSLESMGDSVGYILVNVRTGEESSAVEGASVMVTAVIGGRRVILASGLTNQSGTTEKFALPAPDVIHSQAPDSLIRPYNLFDVSVTAEGFFNARSVDVPVFSGITSVQNFGMIPVPLLMSSGDETVTYFNQEPVFPNDSGLNE